MGSLADTVETAVGKAILQNTSYAAGGTLYLAFGTAASDTSFTELPNANGYARTAMTMSAGNWPEDGTTKGKFTNNFAITSPTASGSWGTPTVVGIFTSGTYGGGSLVAWGAIDPSTVVAVGSGQAIDLAVGTVVITFD